MIDTVEPALSPSRHRLRTFMRRTTDCIIGVGADGTVVYTNPALHSTLGWSAETLLGRSVREYVHPEDAKSVLAAVQQDPDAIDLGPFEIRVRAVDGRWVTFEGHRTNLLADRFFAAIVWILRNVNEARIAESALARHEALLQALAVGSPDVTIVVGEDLGVTYVSPTVEHLFGLRPSEVLGVSIVDLSARIVHPDDHAELFATDLFEETAGAVRYRILRADGSQRWVEASYRNMLHDPAVGGMVLSIRDVNDAHLADLALRESEVRYRSMVEASDEGIWMFDADGRTRFANRKLTEMLGLTVDELIGTPYGQHFAKVDDRVSASERLARRRNGEGERYETTLLRSDGTTIDVYVSATPLPGANGEFDGVLAMLTDLTEYKRLQRERARLQEQREQDQRLASLGRLAGGIAHDFNNLLGVIMNYATLMERDLAGSAALDDLQQIRLAGERAAALTAQLLTFARRQDVQHEHVALNAVVSRFAQMIERTLGDHMTVHLELDPREPEPTVLFDPHQLDRILLNLALNARDAMPAGGTLTLATTYDEQPHAPAATLDGWVQLSVTDTGSGMPPHVAARAFEPFFTTKQTGEGTGLGLATVHGMVTQAGGHTWIETAPGRGTTVEILLPTHPAPAPATEPTVTAGSAGPGRILVVEDEPSLRGAMARLLVANGYEVQVAADGAEALGVLGSSMPVDLVLTDLAMPNMTGLELGAVLSTTHPRLPVVYVSGYESPGAGTAHLEVLRKPVPVDLLLSTIAARLAPPEPQI